MSRSGALVVHDRLEETFIVEASRRGVHRHFAVLILVRRVRLLQLLDAASNFTRRSGSSLWGHLAKALTHECGTAHRRGGTGRTEAAEGCGGLGGRCTKASRRCTE